MARVSYAHRVLCDEPLLLNRKTMSAATVSCEEEHVNEIRVHVADYESALPAAREANFDQEFWDKFDAFAFDSSVWE